MKKQIEDTEYGESLPPPLCLEGATDPVVRHGMANASSTVPGLLGLRIRNLDPQYILDLYRRNKQSQPYIEVEKEHGMTYLPFLAPCNLPATSRTYLGRE